MTTSRTAETLDELFAAAASSWANGSLAESFAVALEVERRARSAGRADLVARAKHLLADVHLQGANFDQALAESLAAVDALDVADRVELLGPAGTFTANVRLEATGIAAQAHAAMGRYDLAAQMYYELLDVLAVYPKREMVVASLVELVDLHVRNGEPARAVEVGEQFFSELVSARAVRAPWSRSSEVVAHVFAAGEVVVLAHLAVAHCVLGDREIAAACLGRAASVIAAVNAAGEQHPDLEVLLKKSWGLFFEHVGCHEEAVDHWLDALAVPALDTLSGHEAELLALVADACKRLGRFEEALAHLERRFELQQERSAAETELRVAILQISNDTVEAQRRAEYMSTRAVELERLASYDSLTGLVNRRRFMELVEASLDAGEHASLVMFDIDHFKRVNDTYGHHAGDDVLSAVAAAALASTAGDGVVARLGGEEFAVLCPGGLAAGVALAERVRLAIAAVSVPAMPDVATTSSFGVAALTPGATPGEVMRAADVALYEAKMSGRNRVVSAAQQGSALAPS